MANVEDDGEIGYPGLPPELRRDFRAALRALILRSRQEEGSIGGPHDGESRKSRWLRRLRQRLGGNQNQ